METTYYPNGCVLVTHPDGKKENLTKQAYEKKYGKVKQLKAEKEEATTEKKMTEPEPDLAA